MGSPADEAVQIIGLHVEIHIQAVHSGPERIAAQDAPLHLLLHLRQRVFGAVARNARGVPRHIAVFKTAQEDDLAEVPQVPRLAELIEESFAGVSALLHRQLLQTLHLLPLADRPKAHLHQTAHPVEVSQMRGAETAEETEMAAILLEVGQGCPRDYSAHAVADHVDDHVFALVLLHVVGDVVFDLLSQSPPHGPDVSLRRLLVAPRHQVVRVRQLLLDPSLDQLHIVRTALKTVAEHHQHVLFRILQLYSTRCHLSLLLSQLQPRLLLLPRSKGEAQLVKDYLLAVALSLHPNVLDGVGVQRDIFPADFLGYFAILFRRQLLFGCDFFAAVKHGLEDALSEQFALKLLELFLHNFHRQLIVPPLRHYPLQKVEVLLTYHVQLG